MVVIGKRRTAPALILALALLFCVSPAALAEARTLAALGPQVVPVEGTSTGTTERYSTQGASEHTGAAELRITAPEAAPKAGEQFTVTVDIVGNPGFAAVQFIMPYDKDVLECTSANPGDLMRGMLVASSTDGDGGAVIAAISTGAARGDGRLAVFTFQAKKDIGSLSFGLEEVVLSGEQSGDISHTVTQAVTKTPTPPEEQRNLEKEAEDVIAEIERDPIWRHEPADSESAPMNPVTPAPETTARVFTDISGHWAEADILRAAELGLIGGYEDGTFRPDANLTRAQFVTILYRQAGRPAVTGTTPFTDIAGVNEEFRTAIAWAYGQKLVDGTSPTTFNPHGTLSRQATMKILFQLSGGSAGAEQMFYSVYDGSFPDSGRLAEWARVPVYWGVYHTLIEAGEGGALDPAVPTSRGQLAQSMVRYMEKFGKEGTG